MESYWCSIVSRWPASSVEFRGTDGMFNNDKRTRDLAHRPLVGRISLLPRPAERAIQILQATAVERDARLHDRLQLRPRRRARHVNDGSWRRQRNRLKASNRNAARFTAFGWMDPLIMLCRVTDCLS
jgi:hypothetical protein